MFALKNCTASQDGYISNLINEGGAELEARNFQKADQIFRTVTKQDGIGLNLVMKALHGRAEANLGLRNFKSSIFFFNKAIEIAKSKNENTEILECKLKRAKEEYNKWALLEVEQCDDDLQDFQSLGWDEGFDVVCGLTETEEFELKHPSERNPAYDRFSDILPCKRTIVDFAPPFLGQYINANHVDLDGQLMIATQFPLSHTREHFLRMIVEQNCRIILNLAKTSEVKPEDLYWPQAVGQIMCVGSFQIKFIRQELREDYNVNHLQLIYDGKTVELIQFHCNVWPDHGAPEYPEVLLGLLKELIEICKKPEFNQAGIRTLFHCKAGAGRTGVAILLYLAILARMNGEKKYNLCLKLAELRRFRRHLIQNSQQYQYVLKCLSCLK